LVLGIRCCDQFGASGAKKISVKEFQKLGYDPLTTTSGDMPDPATIIGWAKDLLKPE